MASPLFVIPSYAQQKNLDKVLEQLESWECVVVDDGSPLALQTSRTCIRHVQNKGYGAAQKSAFQYALEGNWDPIILVHGDNQYEPRCILPWIPKMEHVSIALGSRFLEGPPKSMPQWRRMGNSFLTGLANKWFSCSYSELHTGARIYRRSFLQTVPFSSFSDDFIFDQQMLVWAIIHGITLGEFPMPSKYDASVSSIPPLEAIRYGLGCIAVIMTATRPPNDPAVP